MFLKNILIFVVTVVGFFDITLAGCPLAQKSLNIAKKHFVDLMEQQADLTNNGFVLEEGPGTYFFGTADLTAQQGEIFNKSTTLLFAEQFYYELSLKENFTPLTNPQKLGLFQNISDCFAKEDRCIVLTETCEPNARYQSINGVCNNDANPIWSSENSAYYRLTQANYNDGVHDMPTSFLTNGDLPDARIIGNKVLDKLPMQSIPQNIGSYGGLLYGQFIAHDLGKRIPYQNFEAGSGLRCCSVDSRTKLPNHLLHFGCAPVMIPSDDPILSLYNVKCLNLLRTQTTLPNDCTLGAADKVNIVTAMLDVSNVYGSDNQTLASLRSFSSGQLDIINNVMPQEAGCDNDVEDCWTIGDERATDFPTLGLLHSLFARFHNKLAQGLTAINPQWDDERLFYEARRIAIAAHQQFTYNEWLPTYLGESYSAAMNLTCTNSIYCGEYNPNVNPTASNEFSHGAFRTYHGYIPTVFNLFNESNEISGSYTVSKLTISLDILQDSSDDFLRGLMMTPIQFDAYSEDLRNRLFSMNDPLNSGIGIDLMSNDIIISRDHGIQPYYVFKDMLYKTKTAQWSDLEVTISKENIEKLKAIYESVYDVDLYVGISLEQKAGEYLGPVGKYIIGDQFYRSKYGNKYFYTFAQGPNPFTSDQLQAIKNYSMASFYCENSNVQQVQPNVMNIPSEQNPLTNCSNFQPFNITVFQSSN